MENRSDSTAAQSLPNEWITAAGNALRRRWQEEHPGVADIRIVTLDPMDWAQTALEAAAPLIRAAEREQCAQLAEQVDAFYDAPCPDGVPDCVHQDTPFAGRLRGDWR